ncbi:MADS-box protein CMB2-like isoform X1 [Gossypium australe]|uniref:MADS-box protein CMB2-like isoform X1 n=1 Tax=Gossypium australe TaxID=47621 RepID=A0A5B6X4R1_9ROSI|nr:MADS-box protein CMB2-like isoform X1 [Gossypium australe]
MRLSSLTQMMNDKYVFSLKTTLSTFFWQENLGKQQLLPIECIGQFQNEMHVPFRMGIEQQLQSLAWMPNNDSRHMALPEDPNLIPSRDVECSASSSFGSYSGYFGTPKSSELSSSGQENGILNDLQLGGQCPFFSYDLSILNDRKFPPVAEMNFPETPVDYHVNGVLAGPRAGYDPNQGSWASTSGPCAVTMFDEPLYTGVTTKLRYRRVMLQFISSTKQTMENYTIQCGINAKSSKIA